MANAMRGLGGGDELARDPAGRLDGEPHAEAGDDHHLLHAGEAPAHMGGHDLGNIDRRNQTGRAHAKAADDARQEHHGQRTGEGEREVRETRAHQSDEDDGLPAGGNDVSGSLELIHVGTNALLARKHLHRTDIRLTRGVALLCRDIDGYGQYDRPPLLASSVKRLAHCAFGVIRALHFDITRASGIDQWSLIEKLHRIVSIQPRGAAMHHQGHPVTRTHDQRCGEP